jgi:hypothetical protein
MEQNYNENNGAGQNISNPILYQLYTDISFYFCHLKKAIEKFFSGNLNWVLGGLIVLYKCRNFFK